MGGSVESQSRSFSKPFRVLFNWRLLIVLVSLSVCDRVRFSILSYSVTSVPVSAEFSPASYDKTESAIRDGCGPYRMSHLIIIVVAKALDEKN